MDKANKSNNKKLKNYIVDIVKIPLEIKREVMAFIVKKSMELHSIAFLQWRYLYPGNSEYYSDEILDELITARINFFYIDYSNAKCRVSKKSVLPQKFD